MTLSELRATYWQFGEMVTFQLVHCIGNICRPLIVDGSEEAADVVLPQTYVDFVQVCEMLVLGLDDWRNALP